MDRLSIISDSIGHAEDISRKLTGVFDTQSFVRDRLSHAPPTKHAVVDIDLEDSSYLADLRLWLDLRPKCGKAIFVVEHGVRLQAVQAFAVGATELVERPIDRKTLLTAFFGDIGSLGEGQYVEVRKSPTPVRVVATRSFNLCSTVDGVPSFGSLISR